MRFLFLSIIIIFFKTLKSQNHLIGTNIGFYSFENPHLALNYQFNYNVLNTKIKSVFPYQFWKSLDYSINDIYIGLKTDDEKAHILYINLGASFLIPISEKYTTLKQQVNPILDIGYAGCIKKNHRITLDFSVSKWNVLTNDRWDTQTTSWYPYVIFEIGYAYRFNRHINKDRINY